MLSDPDLTRPYEYDWTGRFGARAHVVVRPQSTAEVARVLSSCAAAGVPVVPQGGNTGLVGGGVPRGGEVLLSLQRLQNLAGVDSARGLVQVGAGVALGPLQHHAREAGFDAALDLGARDSATIGGLVACDAGGARALRYGTARRRVAGLEAVLADGSIIRRLDGLAKDNAGYDVPSLLIGSEGTLAVITEVLWKLEPPLRRAVAALVPLTEGQAAAHLAGALRAAAPSLDACELLTDAALKLVLAQQRRTSPVADAPLYALVEIASNHEPLDELAGAFELAGIEDAAIADDTASRQELWRLREGITDAIAAEGIPHKIDVGVPPEALTEFLEGLERVVHDMADDARTASATSATGTFTSMCSVSRRTIIVSRMRCSDSCSHAAGRSARSTASASPRPRGCSRHAAGATLTRCAHSSRRSTRPGSSTRESFSSSRGVVAMPKPGLPASLFPPTRRRPVVPTFRRGAVPRTASTQPGVDKPCPTVIVPRFRPPTTVPRTACRSRDCGW